MIPAVQAIERIRAAVGFRRPPVVRPALALLAAAGVFLSPRPAAADEAIWLRWNDCAQDGQQSLAYNCALPTFSRSLYVAACPAESLTQVVATSLVFDVVADAATLPDWWRLAPGECRAGKLAADTDYAATGACADAWGGAGGALIQSYGARVGGGPNQMRFVATAGVPANAAVTLPGGSPRALARVFLYLTDSATSPCAGCAVGACLVLNSVEIIRLPGAPGGDVTLSQPAEAGSNFAIWRSGAACVTVPARNRSWGQIKALYR